MLCQKHQTAYEKQRAQDLENGSFRIVGSIPNSPAEKSKRRHPDERHCHRDIKSVAADDLAVPPAEAATAKAAAIHRD